MKPLQTILRRLAHRLTPGGSAATAAVQAGGTALQLAVERHYRHTSRDGFRKAHVSKGQVSLTTTSTSASVNIDSKELAHLILGGRVVPVPPRKALAIPLTPEARAAGNPSNKRIPGVFRPKGTRILARKLPDGTLQALWALAAAVEHAPHPQMEPTRRYLNPTVRSEILHALRRHLR